MDASDAKPLDAGTGRVCASFDLRSAAWLSIGTPHAEHGFVELTNLPLFDESMRGDPEATRHHRLEMTRAEHAFLSVTVDGLPPRLEPDASEPMTPRWSAEGMETYVTAQPETSMVRQDWSIGSIDGHVPRVVLLLAGRLDRPALAEITELEPPAPTGATTNFAIDGEAVIVRSKELPAVVRVRVSGAPVAWHHVGDGLTGVLGSIGLDHALAFTVEVEVTEPPSPTDRASESAAAPPTGSDRVVRRAIAYVSGCTALATRSGERAILTDHRILPLSWTRDAYWQALVLLTADGPGDRGRVADHLRWLWRRCERPDGRWVRSHHANGRRKDLAFQADQQLYPLVELADYWRLTSSLPDGVSWGDEVARAWDAALEHVDPGIGLIGCSENAADDPAEAPFITASQILLWYAALRMAEMARAGALDLDVTALHSVATELRASFDRRIAPKEHAPWPYAIDASGARVAYHDANDLPVALAPIWGFCTPDDPGWTATMEFAFSTANPGWVPGRRPGLGSRHTPGPWSLGLIQAWICARAVGDQDAAGAALKQLDEAAFVDGMLPEALSRDGDARIRHWFAWPGAALAALRLLDDANRLEGQLSVRGLE